MSQNEFIQRIMGAKTEQELLDAWKDALQEHWSNLSRRVVYRAVCAVATSRRFSVGRVRLVGGPYDGLDMTDVPGIHSRIHVVVVSAKTAKAEFYHRPQEAEEGPLPDERVDFHHRLPMCGAIGMALVVG